MVTSTPRYTVVRFLSRALPKQGRGKAIEELCERGSLVTKFAPYGATLPQVDFVNRIMPGLHVLTASYAGVRREGIQQDGDLLYLCITLTGRRAGRLPRRFLSISLEYACPGLQLRRLFPSSKML